jgi:class 3 adenylate cyclase
MRRRSRESGKLAKARRQKAGMRNLTPVRRRGSSDASQEAEVVRLRRELEEAREQQTVAADVLQVISRSTFDLRAVLDTLVESAARVCEALNATIYLRDSDVAVIHSHFGPLEVTPVGTRQVLNVNWVGGHAMLEARTVHVPDLLHSDEYPEGRKIASRLGHRTTLAVPLLRNETAIGAILLRRQEVRPFTDKHIALVENFASQAVIAIENARLLNELRQRTDDLSEALEQQTATSEVLRVISSSPGELEPVFQAMLENATRICEAKFGILFRFDGKNFHFAADVGTSPEFAAFQRERGPFQARSGGQLDRVIRTREVSHTADVVAEGVPNDAARLGGARAYVAVPMFKDDDLVGVINIYRQEVRPFTDKQIELLKNFAAQAVIAIENARLLNELRQSLEQQTATSEVLRVISSSPGELEPVFQAVLENAVRICEAKFANLFLTEGDAFRNVALYGAPRAFEEARRKQPLLKLSTGTALDQMAATKSVAQTPDAQTDPSYRDDPQRALFLQQTGGRTVVCIPLMKEADLVGGFSVYRQEVRPFTEKQIALLQNFAAQAVIAIENARLLDDLNKLNRQLEQRVAEQVGEIERMGRLRRFLPPQVADLIVASGSEKQLESHRREITALFCDLRGFTGFSESSDPEDVMALLRDYHEAIGRIIVKYSGTLERFAGDGVMVIFNDPVPVKNPALQAVLMALDMRTAIGAMIEKWRDLGHDLGFGIGIAHGFATLGTIGFEGRFDYAAIGTVSNVAARLCDEAKPGQILISPRVRQAVDKAVTVEPVGEFTLKGIRRPMMTYNVLEALPSNPN